ncbi:MAG: hypothetical protein MUO77_14285 [Anaerolineales bacterium]|nr:hypothetical protein [Anaerolineales bacterium]
MKSNATLFIELAATVFTGSIILDYVNSSNLISSLLWVASFAILSGIFFFAYLVNGLRAWKWLFPACICAALSEIIFALTFNAINDLWALVFGLAGFVIPAAVAYFNSPRRVNLPAIMQQA